MADNHDLDLISVLAGLYVLTDGNVNDSVSQSQVEAEVDGPQRPEIDHAVARLVDNGLAETIFLSEGVNWLGTTAKAHRLFD